MTASALKLLFDDCISKHAINSFKSVLEISKDVKLDIAHIVDYNLGGTRDDVWIPVIAPENWMVITADRGVKPSRGGKLPHVCRRYRVKHVMFSGSIHRMSTFDKLRAIMAVWPDLLKAYVEPDILGYALRLSGANRFQLESVKDEPVPPIVQQPLFTGPAITPGTIPITTAVADPPPVIEQPKGEGDSRKPGA